MIVDWEHHWIPEELYAGMGGVKGRWSRGVRDGKATVFLHDGFYDLSRHVADMDEAGIDLAVLSYGSGGRSLDEVVAWSDAAARTIQSHPGRLAALAPTQPTWGARALAELDRAIGGLGLHGVQISCQVEDHVPLDSRELWPFYEKVARLDVPIFVHVSSSARGFEAVSAQWDSNITLVREFDLATAVCRVVIGGVLEDFPNLKIVFSHLGGGISAIWERVERYANYWGPKFWGWDVETPPLRKPIRDYLDMLYFDMAGYEGGMNAVRCALTTLKPVRLLFGTDYPANFPNDGPGMRHYLDGIRTLGLSQEETDAMLGTNACRLLGIAPPTSMGSPGL